MQTSTDRATLYDRDYSLWLERTITQLQQRNFDNLDLDNLIEELASMSRSEKRAIYSNLKIVLMHLLKYKYQPSRRSNSWRSTLREHRQRLQRAFRESPNLKRYFEEVLAETYRDARELAADETGLNRDGFPAQLPFSTEQILDSEYLPESTEPEADRA